METPLKSGTKVRLKQHDPDLSTDEGFIEETLNVNYSDEMIHYEIRFGNKYLDCAENEFDEIIGEK